jgi:hypothetical protein
LRGIITQIQILGGYIMDIETLEKIKYVSAITTDIVTIGKLIWPNSTLKKVLEDIGINVVNVKSAVLHWATSTIGNAKIEKIIEVNPATLRIINEAQYIIPQEDYKEVREMFSQLLIASIDGEKVNYIHPKFIEILKQMSPKDVKALMFFIHTQEDTRYFKAFISADYGIEYGGFNYISNIISDFCGELDNADFNNLYEVGLSIENLIKLGVLEKRSAQDLISINMFSDGFEYLYRSDEVIQNTFRKKEIELTEEELKKHVVKITPMEGGGHQSPSTSIYLNKIFVSQFGMQFLHVCLD